jgi:CBS domain-containing protein
MAGVEASGAGTLRIRDILNLKGGAIYSAGPDTPLADAVRTMAAHDVGSLVIMHGGRMVGMLTFREVLNAFDASGGLKGLKARDVMVADPIFGTPDDTIDDLRTLMTEHHVRYLPVLDGEALVGVVSFHDAAKAMIRETTLENRLLRRYIEADPAGTDAP